MRAVLDIQSAPYVARAAANSANYNPPRQSGNSVQTASRQNYQSNPPYYGYQRLDEKGVYQVDENPVDDQPEGFYTTIEDEDDEMTYSDKGFDEIAVNFVGIETSCKEIGFN